MLFRLALFLFASPWQLLLATALAIHAAWRAAAGLRTLRYRANLRLQRFYEVAFSEVPWSSDRLFLVAGFGGTSVTANACSRRGFR